MNPDDGQPRNDDEYLALKAHAASLEQQLIEIQTSANARIRQSELQAEALRAGIIDLDGLKMLPPDVRNADLPASDVSALDIIQRLRSDKPWLFGRSNSSSTVLPPPSAPIRRRLATDMSVEEWRAARSELLRRR